MKKKLNTLRDILVGKVPDPKSQVEQITIAMVFKFMDDMDKEFLEDEFFGGERKFFVDTDKVKYSKYAWSNLMNPQISGQEKADLYREGVEAMQHNPNLPDFFKDVFRNAYIPFRDSETIKLFLTEIDDFTYNSQNSEDLGEAFEMLLSIMSSQGDAGQFRTPRHIIDMIVEIVQPTKSDRILDPACGTAGFLISAYKYILNHNMNDNGRIALTPDDKARMMRNFEGYDISQDMVRLSRVNMYLHHFSKPKINEYDTLTSQDKWDDQFDVIFANPPFMTPKGGINPHNRFRVQANRSEILFVDYIAEHLAPNGKAGIVVPEGVVFQSSNAYKNLRKYLVDDGLLYAVISLPAGVFNPYSGVKTSILLIDKEIAKKKNEVLFIKMENDGFDLGAQRREIKQNDIPKIIKAISSYKEKIIKGEEIELSTEEKQFCTIASKEQIAEQDYILVGERYKETAEVNSTWDIVELGHVCEIISGQSPEGQYYNENGDGMPFYQGKTEFTNKYLGSPKKWTSKVTKTAIKNDIVMSVRAPVGPVNIVTSEICIGRGLAVIRCSDMIEYQYLFTVLKALEDSINGNNGAAFASINKNDIAKIKIPLPPLSVQEEIVAEIEGYQKIIDGAKQVVDNYKPIIKINPDWEIVKLGNVCEFNPKKSEISDINRDTLVSFVPMSDISYRDMLFTANEIRPLGEVYSGYTYFKENDVLLAKVTPCFENGKSGIARNLQNGIGFGSSEFFVLRANKQKILPEIIYYTISSNEFINYGKNNMTGTGGLQRLVKDYVLNYPIALAPLEIQQQLVAQINEEMTIIEQNKRLIEIFEQKIKNKISEIWNSESKTDRVIQFSQAEQGLQFAARNCSDKFLKAVKENKGGDSDE